MSKFRGVAYWSVATTKGNWLNLAMEALKPIENHQIGLVLISEEVINLSFPDGEIHSLKVTGGAGRGTVRQSPNAGVLILCLTALRKAVGDISVVTDSQEEVPMKPKQSFSLYEHDWLRILPVAQSLSMVASQEFYSRNAAVLNRLF